jgi:hypothetical protein
MHINCGAMACRQSGEAIVGNAEGQKTFVEDILALQSKLETILKSAFFNQVRAAVYPPLVEVENWSFFRSATFAFKTFCALH